MGPNYVPPQNNVPEEWSAPDSPISYEPPSPLWWEIFDDPLLNKYIQLASFYNNDVLKAEANIFQTRALRQVAAAPLYPKVSVDYDAFHIFLSKNGPIDAISGGGNNPAAPPPPSKLNIFNAFIDASWK